MKTKQCITNDDREKEDRYVVSNPDNTFSIIKLLWKKEGFSENRNVIRVNFNFKQNLLFLCNSNTQLEDLTKRSS